MNYDEIITEQKDVCNRYGLPLVESPRLLKVGIAKNVKDGLMPLNGIRHRIENGTTGWYIWAGEELSQDPNFFVPLHVEHLEEWAPSVLKYLGLPPGYRFLIDNKGHEDVWEDKSLIS